MKNIQFGWNSIYFQPRKIFTECSWKEDAFLDRTVFKLTCYAGSDKNTFRENSEILLFTSAGKKAKRNAPSLTPSCVELCYNSPNYVAIRITR